MRSLWKRWPNGAQISLHVGFAIAVSFLAQFGIPWFVIGVAWIFGWMIVYCFWAPKTFRVEIRKDKDGTFIVSGLQPEFLTALQKRLVEGRLIEGPDSDWQGHFSKKTS